MDHCNGRAYVCFEAIDTTIRALPSITQVKVLNASKEYKNHAEPCDVINIPVTAGPTMAPAA